MSETAETPKHGGNAFLFVIVCVTLDMLAFGMIVPVMPDLLEELTGLAAEEAVAWAGPLTATFALTNFLAMPTLGSLSDRFGRRPVLLASMAMLALDFAIMGFANALWILFLGRALSGIASATYSTANAYIADTTSPDRRGAAFGMMGAAFGIGFILGPAIGGLLGQIGPRAPFFAAAIIAGLNVMYGLFVLPESLKPENVRRFELSRANPFGAFKHFSKLPHVAVFLVGMGILALAHAVYPATWSFHGEIRYDWGPREIGFSLAAFGLGSALVQAVLMGKILKAIGTVRTALLGFTTNLLAFTAFAFAVEPWMMYIIVPLASLGGVTTPAMNTITSNLTPENAQGELHGATASLNALSLVIAPLIMTQTLYYFSSGAAPVHFPGAAFLLAACLTALALVPVLHGFRMNREKTEQIA
ncbi:MAG: TCR/Tet family MFS transporter [Hyphomonadaceae bacterium]|nr:TCR/Tet family MFS transporter [Hyphomonadaceae bacterium]